MSTDSTPLHGIWVNRQRERSEYEVESNHDETDHVLGNLYVLADLCNDQSQCNQRLCASALKCVAFAMSQNMISLIVVGFYLVNLSAQRGAERRKAMLFSSTSEGGKDH